MVARLAFGQRVLRRYGNDITDLVGGKLGGVTFQWGQNMDAGNPAYTQGQAITLNRDWFRQASRRDARGALIHELTHAARGPRAASAPGQAWAAGKEEQIADAVRFSLNGRAGINPDTLAAAKRIATNRGWTGGNVAGPGSNNAGRGSGAGSNKNTLFNQYSKRTPYGANPTPAPLDPNSYGAYASQVMGLQQQLAAAQALARAGIGTAKSTFIQERDAARALRVNETVSAENAALDRNLVGSSIDMQGRATAITDSAAAKQAALAKRNAAIAAARGDQVAAVGQFYTGLGSAQADLANQQAMANIQRFQNDQFDVYQTNFDALRQAVLRQLNNRGRKRDVGKGGTPAFDLQAWREDQARRAGMPVGDFLSKIFASRRGV